MERIPKEDQDKAWYWESPERDECESKGMYWVPGYFKENGERVSVLQTRSLRRLFTN